MYNVHLGLIGKRIVDFLLVIIELFLVDVTADALRAKIDRRSASSLQRSQFDPKSGRRGFKYVKATGDSLPMLCWKGAVCA